MARGRLIGTLATLLAAVAAPAAAHDHGGWSPATSGPRLGLGAAEVLRAAPPPGGTAPELDRAELLRLNRYLPRAADPGDLGAGPPGGPGVVHRAGGVPVTAGPELAAVPSGEMFSTGLSAGEPTMGVDSKGTLFFVTIPGPGARVVRSTDGGRTWEPALVSATGRDEPITLDPFIYLDKATDRLFDVDFVPPCSPVVFSDDRGDTFSAGSVCNHTDHQNLFTGPPSISPTEGYPNVVYYCSIDGGVLFAFGTFTACSKSLDGGRTFVRTGTPPYTDDPTRDGGSQGVKGHCGGAVGHGAVAPDGTVYLPRGWCGQPFVAISEDEGATWERVQVADLGMAVGGGQEEHEANVAVDRDGNVYYTWIAQNRLPHLTVSRDRGQTWSRPLMFAAPGVNEAFYAGVDVGEPGRIAMVYLGTKNGPGGPFCARTTGPGSCVTPDGGDEKPPEAWEGATWNGYITTTVDALSPDPVFYTASVNAESDPLFRGRCGPSRCGVTHDFFDVVVAPDGTPWASLIDECPGDPDASCGNLGIGIAGHLAGGRPLTGPLPPLPPPAPPATPEPPCTPPRHVLVKVPRKLRRGKLRRLRVTVNGKRVKGARRHRKAWIRIPRSRTGGGKLVVRVRAVDRRGKRVSFTRRVEVC